MSDYPLNPAITNVLVANRGEIARRVFATCRRMGLDTVAVYSDADAAAPHVSEADTAVRLPGNTPAETYLRSALIIDAALATGADAIHPGYGFLSENAEFARAVLDAGLAWIGPPVEAIEQMGSKVASKKLMDVAGVPVLAELDPDEVTAAHLPVLIKASAGGGGRGMRVVRDLADLTSQIDAARREAESAFGDPTVFCERYLETGRHIEVQVMADAHGTIWAVGERECSIQRRHQKVIEEAPSPLVERTEGMRARLFEAARLAAGAIGYTGAGTVEFLADEQGEFFFLEMNTRLQVEHPVTECTTGLDLVRLQLDVAAGGTLPAEPPAMHGYSIEARLYAEDPAHEWQPQSGTVHRIDIPLVAAEFDLLDRPGVRLDTGVVTGSVVGVHYDPMLAKVISYAETRGEAARLLAAALHRAKIHGLVTNRDLLVRVLRHPAFLAGATDTAFFATHGLRPSPRRWHPNQTRRCRSSPPPSPTRPRTAAAPEWVVDCPAAGGICPRNRSTSPTRAAPVGCTRSATGSVGPASRWTATKGSDSSSPLPITWSSPCPVRAAPCVGISTSRATASRSTSIRLSAPSPYAGCRVSAIPPIRSPPVRCSRPCPAA